eukprot:gene4786-18581_t
MALVAAAAARRMQGKCVRFTKSLGIALLLGDDGREYNLFARVARDGIVLAPGMKVEAMLGDPGIRYGWEWQPSNDPTRPRPNITKVWILDVHEPKSKEYEEGRRRANTRTVALKGHKGQRVGIVTDGRLKVTEVETGSPAEMAGVKVGWYVRAVNKAAVGTNDELHAAAVKG